MVVSPLGVSSRILASGVILASTRFCIKTTGQVLFMWLFVVCQQEGNLSSLGWETKKIRNQSVILKQTGHETKKLFFSVK